MFNPLIKKEDKEILIRRKLYSVEFDLTFNLDTRSLNSTKPTIIAVYRTIFLVISIVGKLHNLPLKLFTLTKDVEDTNTTQTSQITFHSQTHHNSLQLLKMQELSTNISQLPKLESSNSSLKELLAFSRSSLEYIQKLKEWNLNYLRVEHECSIRGIKDEWLSW